MSNRELQTIDSTEVGDLSQLDEATGDPKSMMYDLGDGAQIEVYDFDFEDAEKELAGMRSDIRQAAQGDNFYRFLPPIEGSKTPFVQVWQHYVNNPSKPDDPPYVFTCPRKLFGDQTMECEACQRIEVYAVDPDPTLRDVANDISARLRVFAPVIDRSDETVCILSMPPTVYKGVLTVGKNKKATGGRSFVNLKTGFDIVVNREGTTKFNTKYKVYASMEETGEVEADVLRKIPKTTNIVGKIPPMNEVADRIDQMIQYAPRALPPSPPKPPMRAPQRPVVNAAPATRQLTAPQNPAPARAASVPSQGHSAPLPKPAATARATARPTPPAPAAKGRPTATAKAPAIQPAAPITEIAEDLGEVYDATEE